MGRRCIKSQHKKTVSVKLTVIDLICIELPGAEGLELTELALEGGNWE